MRRFGTLPDGRAVDEVTLTGGGLEVKFLTLGATLRDLRLDGVDHSLTLGSDDLAAYSGTMRYYGAIVGPVANRIRDGRILIGERVFDLVRNEGANTLHGGTAGTHSHVWEITALAEDHVTFALSLPDGAEGWPGNRRFTAAYRVSAPGHLDLDLGVTTDAPTHVGPAQHSYWRMGPGPDLSGHRLTILADRYTEVDDAKIPTGALPEVTGTPFDFRLGAPIGPEAAATYDHNFVLAGARRAMGFAARLSGPSAVMTIQTTEPGLQIYDASRLVSTAPFAGHEGQPYGRFAGLAMEPQHWPDAVNHAHFPSTLFHQGQDWVQSVRWSFSRA